MTYLIDALFVIREIIKLSYVVITSPFAFIAGGLLFLNGSSL